VTIDRAAQAIGVGLLGAALFGAACSSSSSGAKANTARAPLVSESGGEASYVSPARFRYHPRERARTLSERALPDGARALAGERGERWLFDAGTGRLLPAALLAPEPLIAVLFDAETDGFAFVGPSGTSYLAKTAIATFERANAPVEALTGVTAAGSSILGVRQSRTLLRSADFGASWAAAGPERAAIVDVAISPNGDGLALAVPETLLATRDFGENFEVLDAASVGALDLSVARDGSVRVNTPLGELVFDHAQRKLLPAPRSSTSADSLPPPARGPDAGAMSAGRAALTHGYYYELATGSGPTGNWDLWSGTLDAPLTRSAQPLLKGCRQVRLAAFDASVLIACARQTAETSSQPIELYFSDSRGERLEALTGRVDGAFGSLRLAVGANRRWILSGVCAPGSTRAGCAPAGIQRSLGADEPVATPDSKPAPTRVLSALAAAPSLAETAHALTFSNDGKTAYAVGRRTKTSRFALFVSQDAGAHFESEELDLGQIASEDSEDDFVERSPGTRVDSLSAAEDGAVAVTFAHYGRRTLVVTDERGKQLSSAEAPEGHSLLSASGLRALALAHKSRQVWESLDGGVSWNPTALLPIELCPGQEQCDVPLRCTPGACVIGNQLTRIGWGGQGSEDTALLPPPLRPLRPPPDRRLRTPLSCVLDATPFTLLPGVTEIPGASEAAIGQAAWFAVSEEPARGQVSLIVAKKTRVETTRLLEPVTRPERYAGVVLGQVEGVAALRYRVPEAETGRNVLSEVEVAWANLFENRIGHARLADGGAYSPGDYASVSGRVQRAQPDLVSVAAGGIYLRLHQASRVDQPTLFLDGQRVVSLPTPSWSRDSRYPARAEMVHVDGVHVPVLFVGRGAALARARRTGSGFSFDAFATGMIDPASFGLVEQDNLAYVDGRVGMYLEVQDTTGAFSEARVFPLRADGAVFDAPVAVPTQRSLGDGLPACDAARRAQTPRVVASFQPGTRHPVVVTDSSEPPRTFLTGLGVLHGTPEAPCVAALAAEAAQADTRQLGQEAVLIFPDNLEHAVLFRRSTARAGQVEYRHMSCKLDAALEIPSEVYRSLK